MSALVGLKTDSWNLTKGKVEVVDYWPMMASPGPMVIILAVYLLFVLRVGPSYMEKRSPYQLKWTLVVYNAVQVVFSVFVAAKCLLHNVRHGLVHSKCLMDEPEPQLDIANCIWWYLIAKITELLDTVFFVLRKKDSQVSFLHIYHHSIMMAGTWVLLKYGPTDHVIFPGFLNSAVHIVMYSYYGLAALGPQFNKYLWWKKYLTRIQLTQFCTMLAYTAAKFYNNGCPVPPWTSYLSLTLITSFLVLFLNFYSKSYRSKKRSSAIKPTIDTPNVEVKETIRFNFIDSGNTEEKQVIRRIT